MNFFKMSLKAMLPMKCESLFALSMSVLIVFSNVAHNPVSCRPSSASANTKHLDELSNDEFCTRENFQNCLNVNLFHSSNMNNQQTHDMSASNLKNVKTLLDSTSSSSKGAPSRSTSVSRQSLPSQSPESSPTDLAFPTTLEDLSKTCQDLKERVKCLDEHSERCFDQKMLRIFGHIVTNAKQFVYDLCDNRRIQSEFLVHAKCFRNISLDEQKCGLEYKDAIGIPSESSSFSNTSAVNQPHFEPFADPALSEWLPNPAKLIQAGQDAAKSIHDAQHEELFMRRSCCALQELVMCKRRHVREQCGEAASIFMRDHLPRITNPVLDQHCSAFTYGPGTCDEALHRRRIIDGRLVQVQPVMFQQQNHDTHSPENNGTSAPGRGFSLYKATSFYHTLIAAFLVLTSSHLGSFST